MPTLTNARHERFAALLRGGTTVTEAAEISATVLKSCDGLIRYYVYVLVDPRDDKVFYVGKGKGRRAYAHVMECRRGLIKNQNKYFRIQDIIRSGRSVAHFCVADGLPELDAYRLERDLIAGIGRANLTNYSPGIETQNERAATKASRMLRSVKAFCRMNLDRSGQALYWDVVAGLSRVAAMGEQRNFKPMYLSAA